MADNIIKSKREAMGLSQSEFAELTGVNLRSLQEYEQGRKPMSSVKSEVVYRISTALDCDMEDLILEPVYPINDKEQRLHKYFVTFQNMLLPDAYPLVNTPFDDVFKTLSTDCTKLLIPLINLAFGENYLMSDEIVCGNNEHIQSGDNGLAKKIISDSNFVIIKKVDKSRIRYQMECQSRPDSSILLRIFEYASEIAAENSVASADRLCISYPRSALIYLRHTKDTPDDMTIELDTPGGLVSWRVPVIKTQLYSINDIFEKKLYMFIPYYILCHEKELQDINNDKDRREKLVHEYELIRTRLGEAVKMGLLSEYDSLAIRNMTQRVLYYYSAKYRNMTQEVVKTMGGQVLEYEAKNILRMGKAEGKAEGIREGIREGRDAGTKEVLSKLLEAGEISLKTAEKYGL